MDEGHKTALAFLGIFAFLGLTLFFQADIPELVSEMRQNDTQISGSPVDNEQNSATTAEASTEYTDAFEGELGSEYVFDIETVSIVRQDSRNGRMYYRSRLNFELTEFGEQVLQASNNQEVRNLVRERFEEYPEREGFEEDLISDVEAVEDNRIEDIPVEALTGSLESIESSENADVEIIVSFKEGESPEIKWGSFSTIWAMDTSTQSTSLNAVISVSDQGVVQTSSNGVIQAASGSGGDSGSLSLMQTVNYTYDSSGDVQVNETTAGSSGYQVDLKNDFSREVENITIVEMHGAKGGNGTENPDSPNDYTIGGRGGLIKNASANVSNKDSLTIWVGEQGTSQLGGWGNVTGGDAYAEAAGGGGGSTEIWTGSGSELVASVGGGGGGGGYDSRYDAYLGGGGGAKGGLGGTGDPYGGSDASGTGTGGDGGDAGTAGVDKGESGGTELGIASVADDGVRINGGSEGNGWILIEYYG